MDQSVSGDNIQSVVGNRHTVISRGFGDGCLADEIGRVEALRFGAVGKCVNTRQGIDEAQQARRPGRSKDQAQEGKSGVSGVGGVGGGKEGGAWGFQDAMFTWIFCSGWNSVDAGGLGEFKATGNGRASGRLALEKSMELKIAPAETLAPKADCSQPGLIGIGGD